MFSNLKQINLGKKQNNLLSKLLILHSRVRKKVTIEKMILSYLAQNPDAADTVEGITRFWMQQENARIAFTKVSDTLAKLLKKGFIQTFQGADGTLYYKLKKKAKP